jgi:hypothetical protein
MYCVRSKESDSREEWPQKEKDCNCRPVFDGFPKKASSACQTCQLLLLQHHVHTYNFSFFPCVHDHTREQRAVFLIGLNKLNPYHLQVAYISASFAPIQGDQMRF